MALTHACADGRPSWRDWRSGQGGSPPAEPRCGVEPVDLETDLSRCSSLQARPVTGVLPKDLNPANTLKGGETRG